MLGNQVVSDRLCGRPDKAKEGDPLTNAIHETMHRSAKIRKQPELGALSSQVRIVEGYYNLDTGKVEGAANLENSGSLFFGKTLVQ